MSSVQFTGVTSTDYVNTMTASAEASNTLTMDDFYALLAAQLQYQDPTNPTDSSEMLAQLSQMEMMDATYSMVNAINELTYSNLTSYATSLMGKEVTVAEIDEETGEVTGTIKGVIEGVSLGSYPTIVINGKQYAISQIMGIGTVPELEVEPETDTDTDDGTVDPDTGDTTTPTDPDADDTTAPEAGDGADTTTP